MHEHNSKYTPEGVYIAGRATRNMDRFVVRRNGDGVVADLNHMIQSDKDPAGFGGSRHRRLTAPLSCNIRGLQPNRPPTFTTDAAVARGWFLFVSSRQLKMRLRASLGGLVQNSTQTPPSSQGQPPLVSAVERRRRAPRRLQSDG